MKPFFLSLSRSVICFIFIGILSPSVAFAIDFTCSTSGGTNCTIAPFDDSTPRMSTINLPVGTCPAGIADVNVSVSTMSAWVGDTELSISSPAATSVELVNENCTTGEDIDAIFDDEAVNLVGAVCNATAPAIAGSVRPLSALSVFDGPASAVGVWTLEVIDDDANAGVDPTALNDWTLSITCAVVASSAANIPVFGPLGLLASLFGLYWLGHRRKI